jgi:hypothetical protein
MNSTMERLAVLLRERWRGSAGADDSTLPLERRSAIDLEIQELLDPLEEEERERVMKIAHRQAFGTDERAPWRAN